MNKIDLNLSHNVLMNKIFRVTLEIQNKFPELYKRLTETPLFLTTDDGERQEFENYLDSLIQQLASFEQNDILNKRDK